MMDTNERPEIPEEIIIQVKNTKKIDFRKPYRFIRDQWWFTLISLPVFLLCYLIALLCSVFFYGLKVVDRRKVRKIMRSRGCIVISNHCHYFDTVFASFIQFPKRLHISVVQRNLEVPYVRTLLRLLFCFPIPDSPSGLKMITDSVGRVLKKKQHVLFLPEGNLVPLSQTIYRFKHGAFHQAYYHQAPIVPMVYVLKRRRILGREMPDGWVKMICVFGDPVLPPSLGENTATPREELKQISDQLASWMENTIRKYQATFAVKNGKN